MPIPRSTLKVAHSTAAFVNFSTPVAVGAVPANGTQTLVIPVPKGFKPGKPTFVILSAPLEAGLNISAAIVVSGNTPNYSANVQITNSTGAAVNSAVLVNTIYQE